MIANIKLNCISHNFDYFVSSDQLVLTVPTSIFLGFCFYYKRFKYYWEYSKIDLDARVSPGSVTTGVPVHNTSMAVVCPLQSGVSKQISANWPRRTCSSLQAILENNTLSGSIPVEQN